MADNREYVQGQDFTLAGGGITSAATTIVVTSFKTPDGTNIVTADIGAKAYATIEPGTSKEENISFTTITQNADGSADLTGVVRGLGFVAPYTTVAANQLAHAGGVLLRITNSAPFYADFANKENDESIDQAWTFNTTNFPRMNESATAPTNDEYLATKKYVDDTAGGTPVSINRVVVDATAGEVVADGNVVYLDETDNEWKLADASIASTSENLQLAIAQGAGVNGGAITGGVLLIGRDDAQSGFAQGDGVFLTDVAGTLGSAAGTKSVQVGSAVSGTEIDFTPSYYKTVATADEKDAMVGTSGTPATGNRFVTNDDTAASGASVVVRSEADSLINDSLVAMTTAGDTIFSDGTDITRLPIGTASQVLTTNSGATAPEWTTLTTDLVGSNTADVTVGNTISETTLYTETIAADTLGTDGVVRGTIFVSDFDLADISSPSFIMRFKYGATTLVTVTIVNAASGALTNMTGTIDFAIMGSGATGTQEGWIKIDVSENEVSATNAEANGAGTGTSAEDSTGALALTVTADWSNAAVANTITISSGYMEIIN